MCTDLVIIFIFSLLSFKTLKMCALSPLFPANLGWVQHYQTYREAESYTDSLESLFHFPPLSQAIQLDQCASFAANHNNNYDDNNNMDKNYKGGDQGMVVKKLSHNASERDRRKKLNALYSSLRSLLPTSDQRKKLSIPATVSRVLKYIPELQQEVERLCKKKQEILKTISKESRANDSAHQEKQREREVGNTLMPGILLTRLTDTQIAIQISTIHNISPLSDVLASLDEYCLRLISASSSSSVSSNGRIFYTLHLEMDGSCQVKCEDLSDKLLSRQDMENELLP